MRFPTQQHGALYLSEGGQETEIMYKSGHHLPDFAMFTLLNNPSAMAEVRGMYQRYLEPKCNVRMLLSVQYRTTGLIHASDSVAVFGMLHGALEISNYGL